MFREVLVADCIISYKIQVLFVVDSKTISENIFVQLPFQIAEILNSLHLALHNV